MNHSDVQRLQRTAQYYNAEDGEDAVKSFTTGGGGNVDDLDNALYYFLNYFDADTIRNRLKNAAEVHPNEVARRVFSPKEETAAEVEGWLGEELIVKYEVPAKQETRKSSLTKLEQARKALGG